MAGMGHNFLPNSSSSSSHFASLSVIRPSFELFCLAFPIFCTGHIWSTLAFCLFSPSFPQQQQQQVEDLIRAESDLNLWPKRYVV